MNTYTKPMGMGTSREISPGIILLTSSFNTLSTGSLFFYFNMSNSY